MSKRLYNLAVELQNRFDKEIDPIIKKEQMNLYSLITGIERKEVVVTIKKETDIRNHEMFISTFSNEDEMENVYKGLYEYIKNLQKVIQEYNQKLKNIFLIETGVSKSTQKALDRFFETNIFEVIGTFPECNVKHKFQTQYGTSSYPLSDYEDVISNVLINIYRENLYTACDELEINIFKLSESAFFIVDDVKVKNGELIVTGKSAGNPFQLTGTFEDVLKFFHETIEKHMKIEKLKKLFH